MLTASLYALFPSCCLTVLDYAHIAPQCAEAALEALEEANVVEFGNHIMEIKSLESEMGDWPEWKTLVNGWQTGADQWAAAEFAKFAANLK